MHVIVYELGIAFYAHKVWLVYVDIEDTHMCMPHQGTFYREHDIIHISTLRSVSHGLNLPAGVIEHIILEFIT